MLATTERSADEHREAPARLRLRWVMRLRWAALGALTLIVFTSSEGFDQALKAGLVVVAGAVSNLVAQRWLWARVAPDGQPQHHRIVTVAIVVDVALLTVLLALTGGPLNPYTFFYVVHVATATVVLPRALSIVVAAVAVTGYGVLFVPGVFDMDAHMHLMHGPGFFAHVRGMWIAFSITAAFIVLFLGQLRHAIEVSERREQALREARDRGRRLASLATLAGGAAHELATPLSTIALIAEGLGKDARLARTDYVRLLGTEVERCVSELRQLSVDAGTPGGEQPVVGAVGPYLEALREAPRVRVRASAAAVVRVPPRAFASALRGLVKNALQASAEDVNLEAAVDGDDVVVTVRDRGAGIDEVTLQRIGEPFFTTKDMGNGMGLGVFLARTVIEQCGGRFEIASVVGVGTTVTVTLPQAAT